MTWQEPKLDWKAGDTPNSGDFNRIEGNIDYVSKNAGKVETVNNKLPDENKNINILPADMKHNAKYNAYGNLKEMFDLLDDVSIIKSKTTLHSIFVNQDVGNDNNDGSWGNQVKTLSRAFELIPKFGTTGVSIVLQTTATFTEVPRRVIENLSLPYVTIQSSSSEKKLLVLNDPYMSLRNIPQIRFSSINFAINSIYGIIASDIGLIRFDNCNFTGQNTSYVQGAISLENSRAVVKKCQFHSFKDEAILNISSILSLKDNTFNPGTNSTGIKTTESGITISNNDTSNSGTKFVVETSGQIFQNAKIHT